MYKRNFNRIGMALLALLVPLLLAACSDGDSDTAAGLSRAEVEEIVRAEVVNLSSPPTAEPGLTAAQVEDAIREALGDTPQPDAGLSRAEVDRIVQAAVAGIPEPQPGLTPAQVDEAIRSAVADIPGPTPVLTSAEAERIARGVMASLPPRTDLAEYTRFFVEKAISRYETQGLDATLAHYNRPESIDGQ